MPFDPLDLLFPPVCPACGAEGAWLCPACARLLPKKLKRLSFPHVQCDAVFSLLPYSAPWVKQLVHDIKFGGLSAYCVPFGRLLAQRCAGDDRIEPPDRLTAVPLHPSRKRQRGFDQAEQLAKGCAAELRVPLRPLLVRGKRTAAQAELDGDARHENVLGAFRPDAAIDKLPDFSYTERHVLLVDDVVTTCATLSAAAAVLKGFGVERVTALTLAYADERK